MKNDVLIIGAGHAGGMTAISLRQRRYQGSIRLIGEENFLPYQRPALSKEFLAGEIEKNKLYLKSQNYFNKNNIHITDDCKVVAIDRNKKTILLDNQKQLGYGKLIIATGSIVKKLKTNGNAKELHYLRTIKDSIKIREKLRKAKNITIIGAGYIGLEIASVAIKKNLQVRILEMENRVMSRVVSAEVSDFFQNKHQSEGVKFKLNTYITQIEDQGKQIPEPLIVGQLKNEGIVPMGEVLERHANEAARTYFPRIANFGKDNIGIRSAFQKARVAGRAVIDDPEIRWVTDRIEYWQTDDRILTKNEMLTANLYWEKYGGSHNVVRNG